MSNPYFRQVPNFDYVSRDSNQRQISEYATVKNLFRRGKLREDIFGDLAFFTKYKIIGDERPDNVAYKIYNDETLDWVILLSNNILNIQSEWPLPQSVFDEVMLEKYGSYENLYSGIHHYESKEIRDSLGNLILPSGVRISNTWKSGNGFITSYKTNQIENVNYSPSLKTFIFKLKENENLPTVPVGTKIIISGFKDSLSEANGVFNINEVFTDSSSQLVIKYVNPNNMQNSIFPVSGEENIEFILQDAISVSTNYYYQYYDNNLETEIIVSKDNVLNSVSNYDYEISLEEEKRNIYVLKPIYLNIVFNDLEELMTYKKGSSQYVTTSLKKGDNIRLYD
jgi:hypothetical protein